MSTGGNTLLEQIVYLPFGPVSSWVWGNGGSYGRSYDPDGRVSAISIVGTTQVPGTRTITPAYDTASRITQIADTSETAKDYGYERWIGLLATAQRRRHTATAMTRTATD